MGSSASSDDSFPDPSGKIADPEILDVIGDTPSAACATPGIHPEAVGRVQPDGRIVVAGGYTNRGMLYHRRSG